MKERRFLRRLVVFIFIPIFITAFSLTGLAAEITLKLGHVTPNGSHHEFILTLLFKLSSFQKN